MAQRGVVRTQRPEAAAPDRRGGLGTDEVALALLEELTARDLCSSGEETPPSPVLKGPRAPEGDRSWTIYAG